MDLEEQGRIQQLVEGGQRDRVVEEDERPSGAELEPAAAHVVQLVRGSAGVGDEHLDGNDGEEHPDELCLASAHRERVIAFLLWLRK